jgi:hypothetical protein
MIRSPRTSLLRHGCFPRPPVRHTRVGNVLGVRSVRFCFASFGRVAVAAGVVAAGVVAAGCGRRATEGDCRLIVDRSVELQMRQMSLIDPSAIRKREEQVRSELQSELTSCEGLRVTDRTISCVKRANTTQELDQCLR